MTAKVTRWQFAKTIGKSERYVYQVIQHGTTSRALAETFAKHLGGSADDYYKEARQRGRQRDLMASLMRLGEHFTFREFVCETDDAAEGSARDDTAWVISQLCKIYLGFGESKNPPDEFESFEDLFAFAKTAGINGAARDFLWSVWQRFKVWRIRELAASAIFDIEIGDAD
jgi:hypothetical protein